MNIGLQHIQVSLRGYGGEAPSGSTFFSSLGADPPSEFPLSPSESAWQAARVELFSLSMKDVESAAEPSEEFAARTKRSFGRAAAFLAECKSDGLERWRLSGKTADVFIGGWLANEQLDLVIPPHFLSECGRLQLPIKICTND